MARTRATTQAVRVGTARVGGGRSRRIGGYAGRTETSGRGGLGDAALDANNRGTGGKAAPGTGLGGGGSAGGTALPDGVVAETKGPGGTSPRPSGGSAGSDPLGVLPSKGSYVKTSGGSSPTGTGGVAGKAVAAVGSGKIGTPLSVTKPTAKIVSGRPAKALGSQATKAGAKPKATVKTGSPTLASAPVRGTTKAVKKGTTAKKTPVKQTGARARAV